MTDLCQELSNKLRTIEETRNLASNRSWEINASLVRLEMIHDKFIIKCSSNETDIKAKEEEENLYKLVTDTTLSAEYYNNIVGDTAREMKMEVDDAAATISKPHPRAPRLSGLSNKIEEFARYKSLQHYLATGSLISPNAFMVSDGDNERSIVTDEEYLAGACIGLCHDLVKYGLSRATNAGIDSKVTSDVQKARDIVATILEELLQFDFRNSPLRRKYDSTKYALKSLETILYELSVANGLGGREAKKMKLNEKEDDTEMTKKDVIPKEEIAAIRARMEHRDQLRERLIKTCRDGQKSGKKAISALHRGDTVGALKLLNDCEKCVTKDLMSILQEEPELRGGSFSAVLEEYVEAYLFYAWLQNEQDEGKSNEPSGKVLGAESLPLMVSPEEYLGGLCDLSGEIGRFAVARGTKRDKKGVQLCLDTNKMIYNSLRMIGRLPGNVFKKKNTLKISVEKLERMMYELNLMEMTGRNEYATALESSEQIEDEQS